MNNLVKVKIELTGYMAMPGTDNKHHAIAIANKRMRHVADPYDLFDMMVDDPVVDAAYGVQATEVGEIQGPD